MSKTDEKDSVSAGKLMETILELDEFDIVRRKTDVAMGIFMSLVKSSMDMCSEAFGPPSNYYDAERQRCLNVARDIFNKVVSEDDISKLANSLPAIQVEDAIMGPCPKKAGESKILSEMSNDEIVAALPGKADENSVTCKKCKKVFNTSGVTHVTCCGYLLYDKHRDQKSIPCPKCKKIHFLAPKEHVWCCGAFVIRPLKKKYRRKNSGQKNGVNSENAKQESRPTVRLGNAVGIPCPRCNTTVMCVPNTTVVCSKCQACFEYRRPGFKPHVAWHCGVKHEYRTGQLVTCIECGTLLSLGSKKKSLTLRKTSNGKNTKKELEQKKKDGEKEPIGKQESTGRKDDCGKIPFYKTLLMKLQRVGTDTANIEKDLKTYTECGCNVCKWAIRQLEDKIKQNLEEKREKQKKTTTLSEKFWNSVDSSKMKTNKKINSVKNYPIYKTQHDKDAGAKCECTPCRDERYKMAGRGIIS